MAWKDVPVIGNIVSWFNKDGTQMADDEIASAVEKTAGDTENQENKETTDYGKDLGDNFFTQIAAVGGGALIGKYAGNKLSGGSKLWTGIGALAGAVVMHKFGTELATDVQRGWQYASQQEEKTGEKVSLKDRFKYIGTNVTKKGQVYEPDPDLDV